MKKFVTLAFALILICFNFIDYALPAYARGNPPVYAVIYDVNGNFLIAEKNREGYFFRQGDTNSRTILQNGSCPLRGGEKYALPGGGLKNDELPNNNDGLFQGVINGAIREFYEETGIQLVAGEYTLSPEIYIGAGTGYYAVYFQYTQDAFRDIKAMAINNLLQGHEAVRRIKNNYPGEVFEGLPSCPLDNELNYAESWNLGREWGEIEYLQYNDSTDWFYTILSNLGEYLEG